MTNKNAEKSAKKYYCENCDYLTFRKHDFDRHLLTRKHLLAKNTNQETNITPLEEKYKYHCTCGRKYLHQSSLCKHKRKCCTIDSCNNIIDNSLDIIDKEINMIGLKDIVLDLIKKNNSIHETLLHENKELRNQINKQSQQISDMIPRIGNHATIKQRFNINVFLNEKCKDAINIDEFIKSIEISVKQLDITHQHGLLAGLSTAIIENINKLSLFERPLHCTDLKRETLYIKDQDSWERDIDKTRIKQAIKSISVKQYGALKTWLDNNPDVNDVDTKQNYFTTILSTIGKDTSQIDEKLIKKICSTTYVHE